MKSLVAALSSQSDSEKSKNKSKILFFLFTTLRIETREHMEAFNWDLNYDWNSQLSSVSCLWSSSPSCLRHMFIFIRSVTAAHWASATQYERGRRRRRRRRANLRWASRSVVHGGRASLLLHKDSFPLLPAARRLGQVSLRRLLSSHRLGQLPLLPIVIGCGHTTDVENNATQNKSQPVIRGNYTLFSVTGFDLGPLHSCGGGSDAFNYRDSLYLVFVWTEQFSGHLSVTRTGLKRFEQHCSFTHTFRQKSGIWSAIRTILMVER